MYKLLEKLFGWLYPLLKKWNCNDTFASYFSLVVNILILCFLAFIIYIVFRTILVSVMVFVAKRTKQNSMIY